MKKAPSARRKKDPESVRSGLLKAAAKIAAEEGVPAITISKVCESAGVTKGALFHHFENRNALIVAMSIFLMDHLDREIDALIEEDPLSSGIFTRAYIQATLDIESELGKAVASLLLSESDLACAGGDWYASRMKRHAKTDGKTEFEIIRYAADGAWLAAITDYNKNIDLKKIRKKLIEMTKAI